MAKYFFDLVRRDHAQYDYQGRLLPAPEQALQLAELMALDLEMKDDGAWSGWSVAVRSAHGQQYFSVPVREPETIVA
jgi:hypothetical protein